jgi:hypothetical protein
LCFNRHVGLPNASFLTTHFATLRGNNVITHNRASFVSWTFLFCFVWCIQYSLQERLRRPQHVRVGARNLSGCSTLHAPSLSVASSCCSVRMSRSFCLFPSVTLSLSRWRCSPAQILRASSTEMSRWNVDQ